MLYVSDSKKQEASSLSSLVLWLVINSAMLSRGPAGSSCADPVGS